MAHVITGLCEGCGVCAKKCPAQAILGQRNERHRILPDRCIDCGICGNLCPTSAVLGPDGQPVPKRKLSQRPKAVVDLQLCTGCEACVAICPEGCIALVPALEAAGGGFFPVAAVNAKRCTGCGLCQTICIKEAIWVQEQAQVAATG